VNGHILCSIADSRFSFTQRRKGAKKEADSGFRGRGRDRGRFRRPPDWLSKKGNITRRVALPPLPLQEQGSWSVVPVPFIHALNVSKYESESCPDALRKVDFERASE